jgi:hypothetical protein
MNTTDTAPSPAAHVARAWEELGESVTLAAADELLRGLERDSTRDLYALALHQSVAVKRNRQRRREMRQLQRQSA